MDNKTIYKKTLVFSLKRVFWDVVCIAVILGFATLGYFSLSRMGQNGYIGLAIGAIVGLIPVIIILRFVSYSLKGERKVKQYMTWTLDGLRFLNSKLGYPNF